MTKDSLDSPIKAVGRRAIAYAIANFYDRSMDVFYAYTYANYIFCAYADDIAIADNKVLRINCHICNHIFSDMAIAIEEWVKLANLLAQKRIFSRANIPKLIADLEELKKLIPNNEGNRKKRQEFIDELFKIWNTAFSLTPQLLNLSIFDEIKKIDRHYFYINRLILDCQKVAVNISPTVWQEIEDLMLRFH